VFFEAVGQADLVTFSNVEDILRPASGFPQKYLTPINTLWFAHHEKPGPETKSLLAARDGFAGRKPSQRDEE
jgi:hypothetical protein